MCSGGIHAVTILCICLCLLGPQTASIALLLYITWQRQQAFLNHYFFMEGSQRDSFSLFSNALIIFTPGSAHYDHQSRIWRLFWRFGHRGSVNGGGEVLHFHFPYPYYMIDQGDWTCNPMATSALQCVQAPIAENRNPQPWHWLYPST